MKARGVALATLAGLFLVGCGSVQQSAVVPGVTVAHAASFDGNQQNSGILTVDDQGAHVSAHFLARYDAMLATLGTKMVPARKAGDREGVKPEGDHYLFDAEAFSRFIALNKLRKSKAP